MLYSSTWKKTNKQTNDKTTKKHKTFMSQGYYSESDKLQLQNGLQFGYSKSDLREVILKQYQREPLHAV